MRKVFYSFLLVDVVLTGIMFINYMATDSPAARELCLAGIIIGSVMLLIERVVTYVKR